MAPPAPYNYTILQDLPDSGRVSVYGVVRSISALTFGGKIIEIADEHATAYVKVNENSEAFFKDLQLNDILRLHRVEIGSYRNERVLLVEIGVYGCHAVAWSSSSDTPKLLTSKSFTFNDQDGARRSELLKWSGQEEVREEIEVSPSTSDHVEVHAEASTNEQTSVVSPAKRRSVDMAARAKPQLCKTVKNAAEIPPLWTKFFNWYAEVLGVYKGKGEPFTVFIKAWDGSLPNFPDYRNMFRATSDSIEKTFCESPSSILAAIEDYTLDVCCYGDWASKALKLEVGDIVLFSNIRNYMCKSRTSSALTMHEGGAAFDRALTVINKNDPIHFEIAKRCADELAKCLGSDGSLIDVASGLNLSPIAAEDVLAQSTPIVSKKRNEFSGAVAINSVAEEAGCSISAGPSKTLQRTPKVIEVAEAMRAVEGDDCLPDDIREQFLNRIESACRGYKRNFLLKELREPKRFVYSLTDEMEEILKMDIGQNVRIMNFVEAEINVLKEERYLRCALIFTAKCLTCEDEFIVERDSKNWCRKCCVEHGNLRDIRYSYRILMPAVYTRGNGQKAQLILAIASHIWINVPGSTKSMSEESMMELYSEHNISVYVKKLNKVLRFSEAVMAKRKVSHIHGKIVQLVRETGSIGLFVDHCMFTDRGKNNGIVY